MHSDNPTVSLITGVISSQDAALIISAVIIASVVYLIYRISIRRLKTKTREAEVLSKLHLATAESLATAIDAQDQTSHGHVRRVQIFAVGLGEALKLSQPEIDALRTGALLHDVGKLAVPAHILNKPGRLTAAEFEKMKVHTTVGAELISRIEFPYPVVPIVRHHHEHWNGGGYPDGLRGEQIPLAARIISVADCFDAIREDRPFRRGMTREEAIALLRRGAGTHFDPQIVEVFIEQLPKFESQIAALELAINEPKRSAPEKSTTNLDLDQAIERGCLMAYEEIKNAHQEVFALYEIARTFGSSLDVRETLEILVDKVGHIVSFDTCVVYLYEELRGYASAAHVVGKNASLLATKCVAPGEGVTGFALANRSPVNQLHPSLDFLKPESERLSVYESMASLPLFKDDVLLGALSVYSMKPDRYTDDQMRMLETVTKLASDALGNAVHHAEAKSNALTDVLTGLPNARYLTLRFEEEVARARRMARSFQLMMLDLDGFKAVNDTFGHKVGDKMLREVALIIQRQFREYDFLARYAGDEFVALVQELSGTQVEELSVRIEQAVAKFSLHVRGDKRACVGISIGTATYNGDGETLDQLLVAADQAMYRVKFARKLQRLNAATVKEVDQAVSDLEKSELSTASVN